MKIRTSNPVKVTKIATIATLFVIAAWELVSVIAQIKPFWVDEWRVIYNLKFKTFTTIWGPLDYMQQFPRVYLIVIKAFASMCDYSYFSLRLPSYILGILIIGLVYKLTDRLYAKNHFNRFLFIMVLISSCTFTNYFVQIKQYTMDIFLSLVALWQLTELIKLNDGKGFQKGRYALLCASFLVVPFFSYTYPIAVAPVFLVMLLQSIYVLKNNPAANKKALMLQWFPLVISVISIAVFYLVDVSQLMADKNMYEYWHGLMRNEDYTWRSFVYSFFNLFAEVGAGLVFWLIFGILGTLSFIWGVYICARNMLKREQGFCEPMLLYSIVLLSLVLILSLAGKYPVGEPRLNAFTVPSISIIIIYLLDRVKHTAFNKLSVAISVILYLGVIGNIYTTLYAEITGPVYARKMDIYKSTENAILLAQEKKLPILITSGVAFPYDTTRDLPFKTTVPGDWVLKTFPAYKVAERIPVYAIKDLATIKEYMQRLPPGITAVLVGDGRIFHIVTRDRPIP